jgi:hypothetical protein
VALALLNKTDPEKELRRMRNVLRGKKDMRRGRRQEGSCVIDGPRDLRSSLVHLSDNKLCERGWFLRKGVTDRFWLFPSSCSYVLIFIAFKSLQSHVMTFHIFGYG